MLARALARRREMGIRLALGSSRMRLLRQLLIENLMLSAAGGLHRAGRRADGRSARWSASSPTSCRDGRPSRSIFASSPSPSRSSSGRSILFGWAPALHAVGGDLRSAVNATTNGTTGAPRGRRTLWCPGGRRVRAGGHPARVRHAPREGLRSRAPRRSRLPIRSRARRDDPAVRRHAAEARTVDDLLGRFRTARVAASRRRRCRPDHLRADLRLSPREISFRRTARCRRPDGKDPVVLTRYASPGYFGAMGIRLQAVADFCRTPDGRPKQLRRSS